MVIPNHVYKHSILQLRYISIIHIFTNPIIERSDCKQWQSNLQYGVGFIPARKKKALR